MNSKNSKIENKCILKTIRSKYIIKIILLNLNEYVLLNFIKYNKNYIDICEKSKDDYKNLHFKIEIQLFPFENKKGNIINLTGKNMDSVQIFYNNNYQERKINLKIEKNETIIINIIIDKGIDSLEGLFRGIKCLKRINFIKFFRQDITNMSNLFKGSNIEIVEFSKINTDNVTNMSCMFYG